MLQNFLEKLTSNSETKPFWQSSEFYILVGAAVFTIVEGPSDSLTQLIDALSGTYSVSRGLAKSGSPKV